MGLARGARSLVHFAEDDIVISRHMAPFIREAEARGVFEMYDIVFLDMWVNFSVDLVELYARAVEAALGDVSPDYGRFAVIDLKGLRFLCYRRLEAGKGHCPRRCRANPRSDDADRRLPPPADRTG